MYEGGGGGEGEDLLYQDIKVLKRKQHAWNIFKIFSKRYVQYSFTVCPNMTKILNKTSGVITIPFYLRFYSNIQSCSWEIRARKGKRILLTIEEMYFNWWCIGAWSCSCDYLEIQGGSVSGYGPKWRVCHFLAANATYDWFKERIKVLFVSNASAIRANRRLRVSYTQVNFSVSGK